MERDDLAADPKAAVDAPVSTPRAGRQSQAMPSWLQLNPLNLTDRDLVFGPVVRLGSSGRLMGGIGIRFA